MIVWICSDGDYSDYHVTAVYSNKDKAIQVSNAYAWGNPVEEFELDPAIPSQISEGLSWYRVTFFFNALRNQEAVQSDVTDKSEYQKDGWSGARHDGGRNFNSWQWARDKEHAIKIAAEKMASLSDSDEQA